MAKWSTATEHNRREEWEKILFKRTSFPVFIGRPW
jgi:hypothetical protein